MAHLGRLLLLFLGLCSSCSSVPREFHVVKEKKNWTDAQQYCRKKFTDLTTIDNETEMKKVQNLIHDADAAPAWIGLRAIEFPMHTKGKKIITSGNNDLIDVWEWSDNSSSSFRQWMSGEPNFGNSEVGYCAEVQSSGGWNDAGCHHVMNFICYEALSSFVLVRESKTWLGALQHCREHYVDLVSVPSEQIQHLVAEQAKTAYTAQVWLGLHYVCGMDFWFWVNGETVCYSNWASENKTGQGCVTSGGAVESKGDRKGQWVSLPVTEERNFICTTKYQ